MSKTLRGTQREPLKQTQTQKQNMKQNKSARNGLLAAAFALALLATFVLVTRERTGAVPPLEEPGTTPFAADVEGTEGEPAPDLPLASAEDGDVEAANSIIASADGERATAAAPEADRFVVRVLDEDKQPVPDAVVYRDGLSRESVRQLERTDAQGRVTLAREHFPARRQSLFAVAPNGKSTLHSYGSEPLVWPGPVELWIAAPPEEPGCFGRVLGATSDMPIEGASVALFPAPNLRADGGRGGAFGAALAPVRTDGEGQFRLPYVSRFGSVEVLVVSVPGYAPTQIRWSEVEAAQEAQTSLDVALHAPITRRGTVRFDDGAPARGVTVGVRPVHAPFAWLVSTRTDQDGQFELSTPPGEVTIEAFLHAYVSDSDKVEEEVADIELELPYESTTRVILQTPDGLDLAALSLYVEDEFGLTEYALVENEVPIYVMGESEARLTLAAPGSGHFESFVAVASAEGVQLKGEVTQVVELRRPEAGILEVQLSASLLERLGQPKEVHLIAFEEGLAHYARNVQMEGSTLRMSDVPARNLRVSVDFHGSLEIRMEAVEVRAAEVTTVLFDR